MITFERYVGGKVTKEQCQWRKSDEEIENSIVNYLFLLMRSRTVLRLSKHKYKKLSISNGFT